MCLDHNDKLSLNKTIILSSLEIVLSQKYVCVGERESVCVCVHIEKAYECIEQTQYVTTKYANNNNETCLSKKSLCKAGTEKHDSVLL